ncbi:MAG: nitroreductase family deazaflavin-dependent oxidoreductase, partial [Actinobacteria bacterium]|nr:nitroreductase family deazaflavin-dependent oxidoreductase [Actinomycetota bacterium]NIU17693.1 nitroreductase family deazaflavin-dependent oxidoreductase [Actinomycetota bacterium]NIV54199.1 nitroreductase family deazaflavin-dependent oxidoreductase [Actinomycetota bacterium]
MGRRTGTAYVTPVFAFFGDGHGFVPLTYGPRTDWARNVLASGGVIRHGGRPLDLATARLGGWEEASPHLPRWVRVFLGVLRVRTFVV